MLTLTGLFLSPHPEPSTVPDPPDHSLLLETLLSLVFPFPRLTFLGFSSSFGSSVPVSCPSSSHSAWLFDFVILKVSGLHHLIPPRHSVSLSNCTHACELDLNVRAS